MTQKSALETSPWSSEVRKSLATEACAAEKTTNSLVVCFALGISSMFCNGRSALQICVHPISCWSLPTALEAEHTGVYRSTYGSPNHQFNSLTDTVRYSIDYQLI